jgi:selenide,water dikinase
VRFDDVPVIPEALEWVKQGVATGASERNWKGYGESVEMARKEEWLKKLVTDPQTSGGLLVSCAPEAADQVLGIFAKEGFSAKAIGELREGAPKLSVI